jgi:hypothetical protein
MNPPRRRALVAALAGGGALALSGVVAQPWRAWFNRCQAQLPAAVAAGEWVQSAWDGVDPVLFLDSHVHLVGTGDSDSGSEVNPQMDSFLHPLQYAQRLFYLNAGCVHDAPGRVDESYVDRLQNLVEGLRPGAKLLLFAFDRFHDLDGRADPQRSSFYTPNAYAQAVAARHPQYFQWAASIHPYRGDCVEALAVAVEGGARAVKWLPPAMGIDPSSKRCDRFYAALAKHGLPLISHAGEEKAAPGGDQPAFGNPLLLRRAMDHGVRVVVAHCASLGSAVDVDRGANAAPLPCFDLFARLMGEARYEKRLFGDISALTLRNRNEEVSAHAARAQRMACAFAEWFRLSLAGHRAADPACGVRRTGHAAAVGGRGAGSDPPPQSPALRFRPQTASVFAGTGFCPRHLRDW